MPYTSISEARIKKLHNVPLTLAQINAIAKQADAIGGEFGWPTAIKIFEKNHHISGGAWVENEKEAAAASKELREGVFVEKEGDRYKITAISTAAVPDSVDETFTTNAMDYEIKERAIDKDYPEFRAFHSPLLGIGRVTSMKRVGIFAVDEGYSYDDPFSKEVCEKMLVNNDGRWRVSRGFYVRQASGGCPTCKEKLVVGIKHMIAGFRCPNCKSIHPIYKGALSNTLTGVRFLKTKTFDVTVTDRPCLAYTGVVAIKDIPEVIMTKEELIKRLKDAGISDESINTKLKDIDEARLKELTDIPDAVMLKELGLEIDNSGNSDGETLVSQEGETDDQTFVLDDSVLKAFASVASTAVKELLDNFTIEIPDAVEKESPQLVELKERLDSIEAKLDALLGTDETKIKNVLKDMPRSAKLRITRIKAAPAADDEEDTTDQGDDEMMEGEAMTGMFMGKRKKEATLIVSGDGFKAGSMTEFITGGGAK